MKALSVKQPFAELIVSGKKRVELRKWNTKFRGVFLVHASKVPDKEAMEGFGFSELPLGCVVGKAEIVNVKKYSDEEDLKRDKGLHLANGGWGLFGFVLENVRRVNEIPCKGKLGFWEVEIGQGL
jgi:ASC-1-like (ASCH) protein